VVLVLAIALMGCGTASDTALEAETAAGDAEETCFNVRDARSYRVLHDRYVFVRCVHKRQYLLTIDRGCRGLSHGFGIAISNEFNRVCSQSGA